MSSEIQKSQLTLFMSPLQQEDLISLADQSTRKYFHFFLFSLLIMWAEAGSAAASVCEWGGIWVAVAPRIQRCFLQSIATRFVRKLSSRASGVGRSSAKRMYVHSFYQIRTNTYTFYVRIFVCIYTRDFRVSTSSASDTRRLLSWAHTLSHTHTDIYSFACRAGWWKKINQRTRVLISCHGFDSLKRIEGFLGVGLFGQTLNKSNELNVTPISMQLQDNAQPKKKKNKFLFNCT